MLAPFALAVLACSLPPAATLRSPGEPMRVLVRVADATPPFDESAPGLGGEWLTREVERELRRELSAAGLTVIDGDRVAHLVRRAEALRACHEGGGDAPPLEHFLGAEAQADLVVCVRATRDLERMQRGRHVARDELEIDLLSAQDPIVLFRGSARAEGRSPDSSRAAHRVAIEAALTAGSPDDLLAELLAAIEGVRRLEEEQGRSYRVRIASRVPALEAPLLTREELHALPGVVAGSCDLEPGAERTVSCRLRVRGPTRPLHEGLTRLLARRGEAVERETGQAVGALVLSTHRSLEVVLDLREPPADSVDEELAIALDNLARELYREQPEWYDEARLRFEPAELPLDGGRRAQVHDFVESFWQEYDRLAGAGPGAGPLASEESVRVAGRPFDGLGEAREEATRLARAFHESRAGRLALGVAAKAEEAFGRATDGAVKGTVADPDVSTFLYALRSEARLQRSEGAADPDSIAFFQTQGADRLVLTRLSPGADSYQLRLTVYDTTSGAGKQASTALDPRLSSRLEEYLSD